jgi:HlyD family secretion protein
MKFWITTLLVLAAAGTGGYLWWKPRQAALAEPVYRTFVVARGEIVQSVTATGQLSPLTTVEVGSQVSGRIAKRYVDFNDPVKKDQLLAEIDPSSYEARVLQSQAELESAQANLDLKKLNADRAAELRKNQIVSQSDYDLAMAEYSQQRAAVRIREASLENSKLDLSRTKIYAPIDGVVISRDVDVGQTVQASFSAPKLFSIAQDLRQMEISASVSEADIGGVAPGQPVEFIVDAYPDRKFNGTVRQVRANSIITQNVVTYPTIITVENDELKLLPGMTANVVITTARRPNVLQVPNAALRFRPPDGANVRPAEVAATDGKAAADELTIDQVPGLEQIPAEFKQRMFERFDADKNGRLNPAEVAALQEARAARMAAGGGGGGARGPGGGGRGDGGGPRPQRPAQDVTRMVYVLANPPAQGMPATGDLISKTVKIGVTDGANTEIVSGLDEGDMLVVGIVEAGSSAAASTTTTNPFAPQFPRGGRR